MDNSTRLSVDLTPELRSIVQALRTRLSLKTGNRLSQQDVLRVAVVALAKKEKVGA